MSTFIVLAVFGVAMMFMVLDWLVDMVAIQRNDRGPLYAFRIGAICALVGVAVAVVMAREAGR